MLFFCMKYIVQCQVNLFKHRTTNRKLFSGQKHSIYGYYGLKNRAWKARWYEVQSLWNNVFTDLVINTVSQKRWSKAINMQKQPRDHEFFSDFDTFKYKSHITSGVSFKCIQEEQSAVLLSLGKGPPGNFPVHRLGKI